MYQYSQHRFLNPPAVFGLRLVPFTLGHADVLTGAGHPSFGGESNGAPADLGLVVFICSRPWEKAADQIRTGKAQRILQRMGRRFSRMSSEETEQAATTVSEYIEVYSDAPPRWDEGKPGETMRAPWHLAVFAMLQEKTNLTPAETWALPAARALELAAVIGANQGDDSLVSPAEMDVYKKLMSKEGAEK